MPNRREFLQTGLIVSAAAALPSSPGAALAAAGGPSGGGGSPGRVPPFELDEMTIGDLRAAMDKGKLSAAEITRAYLARADAIDHAGFQLRAILERNPDAVTDADTLDRERQKKGPRGPLHGIPILIKDNIDVADKTTTTGGSLALEGSRPPRDAFVVERLRALGAVILGKTNLSEWANIRSSFSSSGWSARGGQTKNPCVLDRNPCGSSSGSAAAAAANLAAAAVGTETDGSVVCPASCCGIVGIKPTVGLLSRAGIIPISPSQDTAGPMARTVTDAALLLGAMAATDPRDPITQSAQGKAALDYTRFLDPKGLKGARLGVARKLWNAGDRANKLLDAALEDLKKLGAILVDPAEVETVDSLGPPELEVLLTELKESLPRYLGTLPKPAVRTLAEVIAFNQKNAAREMAYFGQDLFEKAEAKGPLTSDAYRKARESCLKLARTDGIDATMDKHKLDAIVAPTIGPPGPIDLVIGDHFIGGASTAPAVAGYPHVTVPAGSTCGLPVGLSFFGRAWSEPVLLKLAFAYEHATRHRAAPRFLATADLTR